MTKKSRKETSPFNYLQDQLRRRKILDLRTLPSSTAMKRLVEAVEEAPRNPQPTPPRFNIYNTQRLPDRYQQALIAYKRAQKTRNRTRRDRKRIATMQQNLMRDLGLEDGNSSSDQSYYSAHGSPQRRSNSSSDQSYYSAHGSPQRRSTNDFNYLQDQLRRNSPSFSEKHVMRKLVDEVRDAKKRKSPVRQQRRRKYNFFDTQKLPNEDEQIQIFNNRMRNLKGKRKEIVDMQRQWMDGLDIEDGPNGSILSINNSPRRKSNSSSDQSYYSAHGSPQRRRSSSSDEYYSAHSNLDDSIQVPRYETDPAYYGPALYDGPRTSSPLERTPPAFIDFGGQLSPITQVYPTYESSRVAPSRNRSVSFAHSRNASGSFEQPMDISGTILEPMDISSRVLEPMDISTRYNFSRI